MSQALRRYLALSDDEIAGAPVAVGAPQGVPVIDISELMAAPRPSMSMRCVQQIVAACKEWGFFQVIGHGVSQTALDDVVKASQGFFALPKDVKQAVKRAEGNSKGWFDDELTKQRLDWKEGFDYGVQEGVMDRAGLDGCNQWPRRDVAPDFERVAKEHFENSRRVALKLLSAMAVGIGVPYDHYHKHFERDSSFARLNHYPPCPQPDAHWAISHHTDAGAVTVLYQPRVKSLQVFNLNDLQWYDVDPFPQGFTVNTGDIMQVWSNDMYRAPLHRVKAQAGEARYSIPLFLNPSYDTDYQPSRPTPASPAAYTAINWGAFRMARFKGDYADVGREAQIAHYRTGAKSRL